MNYNYKNKLGMALFSLFAFLTLSCGKDKDGGGGNAKVTLVITADMINSAKKAYGELDTLLTQVLRKKLWKARGEEEKGVPSTKVITR